MIHTDMGKIIRWDSTRNLGTIRSESYSQEILVQSSAFGKLPRHPMVGDSVLLDNITNEAGNLRATKARIKGVSAGDKPLRKMPSFSIILTLILAIVIFLVIWGVDKVKFPGLPITHITTPKIMTPILSEPENPSTNNASDAP